MDENFLPITGYEGLYEIGDRGTVRTISHTTIRSNGRICHVSAKIRSHKILPKGHHAITLMNNGTYHTFLVHRLVLLTFIGPPPIGSNIARHLNDNPSDNRLENLSWGTASDNQYDAVRNGKHYLGSLKSCRRGHPLRGNNLKHDKHGKRICRACSREYDEAYRAGRPFSEYKANARYLDIVNGVKRNKSEHRF